MTQVLRRFRASESGASLVEFAILAPVMVFLLVGIVDIGRYTYYGILAANAARAGAQYGSQSLTYVDDYTGIQNAALNDGQSLAWTTTPQCLVSVNGGSLTTCPAGGSTVQPNTVYYVRVTTTGTFNTLIRYPGLGASDTVTGSSTMRVASQ